MSRILAVVITYFPEEEQLLRNIGSFIDEVDRVIIWENTPADQAAAYRFIQHPKITYMGEGANVGISKALNLVLSYAQDKGYEYFMTMDQDSDWENFSWYKSVIVDNSAAPEALFGPYRYVQSIEAQRVESDNESHASIIPIHIDSESYPQFVDNCPEAQLIPTMNLITSGMMAKTSLLVRIGGYWKDLFVDGIDEELVCRAKVQGVDAYFVKATEAATASSSPQPAVFHHQLGYPIRKRLFGKEFTVPGYSKERLYDRFRSMFMIFGKFNEEKYPPEQYPELAEVRRRLQYDWLDSAPVRIMLGADHRFSKLCAISRGTRHGRKYVKEHFNVKV